MIAILEDKKSFRKTVDLPYFTNIFKVLDHKGICLCVSGEVDEPLPSIDFRFSHWLEPNEVAIYKEVL